MNILVCYKIVPEEQDIEIMADKTLSFDKAVLKIGQYDLNAIEAGVQLAEHVGGKAVSLTVGGKEVDNSKMKKSILSRGPAENYAVMDEAFIGADSMLTAKALAAAAEKIGQYDLILCGEGSSDLYAQQVGIQLGELLGIPALNGINKITIQDEKVVAERVLENEAETLEVALPAVLSVTADSSLPRIPGMKEILGAGKKPTVVWTPAEIGMDAPEPYVETIATLAPEQTSRQCVIVAGDDSEAIEQFFGNIRGEF